MKRKTLIKIMIIILFLTLITSGNVKAVYQSTPQTYANPQSQTWDAWLTGIRTMETTGGAMGLEETLNGTDATSSSNNIDVHMAKATEYGAVALLSASPYGNPNNTQKPETSTGDTKAQGANGAFYNYDNWEYTACIAAEEAGSSFSKYWDKYNTLSLRGLSPSETWHGGSSGIRINTGMKYSQTSNPYKWGNPAQYYISANSYAQSGRVTTVLSTGKNGIFSYNWGTRSGDGYALGSKLGGGPDMYALGNYYSTSSFYARGSAVNMEGI